MYSINSVNLYNYVPEFNFVSMGQKLASRVIPFYTLNVNLESIKQRISVNPAYALSDDERAQVKEAFVKSHPRTTFKKIKVIESNKNDGIDKS